MVFAFVGDSTMTSVLVPPEGAVESPYSTFAPSARLRRATAAFVVAFRFALAFLPPRFAGDETFTDSSKVMVPRLGLETLFRVAMLSVPSGFDRLRLVRQTPPPP